MRGWLLDTNIISELRKPNCNANVKQWSDGDRSSASIELILAAISVSSV